MVIVAAVDRSNRASDVLRESRSLAVHFDEPIHVVHVLTSAEFVDLERTAVDETGTAVDMDEVRQVAGNIAAEAAEAALESDYEAVGLMGDPAVRIVDYAREHDTRYIVVAGRKRSPAGKVVFGSVTQSILLNADCPVVTTIR